FTGVRKGEKLFEELEITGENLVKTRHPKIFIGNIATYSENQIERILVDLRSAIRSGEDKQIRRVLTDTLPEAKIDETEITTAANGHKKDEKYFPRASRLGLAEK